MKSAKFAITAITIAATTECGQPLDGRKMEGQEFANLNQQKCQRNRVTSAGILDTDYLVSDMNDKKAKRIRLQARTISYMFDPDEYNKYTRQQINEAMKLVYKQFKKELKDG